MDDCMEVLSKNAHYNHNSYTNAQTQTNKATLLCVSTGTPKNMSQFDLMCAIYDRSSSNVM